MGTHRHNIERKWSVKVLLERSRIAGGLLVPLVLYIVLISFCLLIPYNGTTSHYKVTTTKKVRIGEKHRYSEQPSSPVSLSTLILY
jgi:hypothetical protein